MQMCSFWNTYEFKFIHTKMNSKKDKKRIVLLICADLLALRWIFRTVFVNFSGFETWLQSKSHSGSGQSVQTLMFQISFKDSCYAMYDASLGYEEKFLNNWELRQFGGNRPLNCYSSLFVFLFSNFVSIILGR